MPLASPLLIKGFTMEGKSLFTLVEEIKSDPISEWGKEFMLTNEEAESIQHPKWIYKNLIIEGHVIALPAPPNGGKTTIIFHIACELARKGREVHYINADISGGDSKAMNEQAMESGVILALPDLKGLDMDAYVDGLKAHIANGASFGGKVFIFDTLKKMTDVISKRQSKELFTMLRQMSAKGATILLLAHTNKYNDQDGNPIYEGTADLRSDVDELIYLVPVKNEDGSITVSTKPDKVRGDFQPITFRIDSDRNVTRTDYVDTSEQMAIRISQERDELEISQIETAIETGHHTQQEIIDYCRTKHQTGIRTIKRDLKVHAGKKEHSKWSMERGMNNAKRYHLPEKSMGV